MIDGLLRGLYHRYRHRQEIRKMTPPDGAWGVFGPDDPWTIELSSSIEKTALALRDETVGRYLRLLGRSPRRSARSARIVRVVRHSHAVERYLLLPGGDDYDIPARMLVPNDASDKRVAAVVSVHGHERQGARGKSKVFDADRRNPSNGYGHELVRRGFAVLAIDLAGFEDRRPSRVQPGPWSADPERLVAQHILLRGATPMGLAVFDLSRAVDALVEMPEINPARIAAFGHSMGGSIVPSLLLFDSRVTAGVSVAGLATWRSIMQRHVIHNFAAYVPGLLTIGDTDALYTKLAPRPFALIAGARDDNFPVEGVRMLVKALEDAYAHAGARTSLVTHVHGRGHAMDHQVCEVAFNFLERWRAGDVRGTERDGRP